MIFRHGSWRLALLFFSVTLGACVSLNMGGEPPQKSGDVSFKNPSPAFVPIESKHLDKSWQDPQTGSTISFLSDCFSAVDPSLENILRGILSSIEDTNIIESHHIDFNAREALHSTVDGRVDGINTRFELVIFKKNNCTYILTYAAKEREFGSHQRDFLDFVKGFKVP